jgi:predicted dehydrogenase
VVGYGYWGPNLARNFRRNPNCTLTRIVDIEPRRLQVAQSDLPGVDTSTRIESVMRADDIDAIAIATPIETHYDLAMEALRHNKHVLVEKPMAHSVRCCEQMIAEAARRDLTLMVDHTFVYTEAVRWMRAFAATEKFGDLFYVDSVRTNLGLFQRDADVIWDLAPHDIAVLHALAQRPIVGVSATGACHAGSRQTDIAYLSLDLDDGVMAHIHVNWLSPIKIRRMTVAGSSRMMVFDDMETSEKVKVYDSGVSIAHRDEAGQHRMKVDYRVGDMMSPALPTREALQTMVEHFLRCVRGEEMPLTGGESGLAVVRVLEAAQCSLRLGGERISL